MTTTTLGDVEYSSLGFDGLRSVRVANGVIYLESPVSISPTQITSDQNNYNPTGLSTASILNLDADSSFRSIGGLAGGTAGRILMINNISANTILFSNEATTLAASSTATNRFAFNNYDFPLFPKQMLMIVYSGSLSRWIRMTPSQIVIPSPDRGFYHHNEYIVNASDQALSSSPASGGSNSSGAITGIAAHPGICRMTAGTSTTGNASLLGNTAAVVLGNSWYWRYDTIVRVVTLSDGTNTYVARFGFIDSTSAESTDGVFFRYTDSVNSGKWVLVARSNGSETTTNATNAAVASSTWYHLTIIVNPAGSLAEFFQDGTSIGTVASNIPVTSGSRACSYGVKFLKSAGTSNIDLIDVDAITGLAYSNVLR